MKVGLDVGSTTIKCVVLDDADNILYSTYERHFSHILEKSEELLRQLRDVAQKTVDAMPQRKRRDDGEVSRAVRSAMSSYLYKHTKRSPMVIPMITRL